MTDTKTSDAYVNRFDRPAKNLASKNTGHAPWHDDDDQNAQVKSQHRRYHSLFEDLMN